MVGHDHHAEPLGAAGARARAQPVGRGGVQRGERLVEQQHPRTRGAARGRSRPAAAARGSAGAASRPPGRRGRPRRAPSRAASAGRGRPYSRAAKVRFSSSVRSSYSRDLVRQQADGAAGLGGVAGERPAQHAAPRPRVGPHQAGEHPEQRALARAVRARRRPAPRRGRGSGRCRGEPEGGRTSGGDRGRRAAARRHETASIRAPSSSRRKGLTM